MCYNINDGIINGKNRLLSYIILYYLQFCSVKMSVDSLNELLEKLDSVNYPPIPPCALVLIERFKVVTTEIKVVNAVNKRISVLEDINAISINTTDYLKLDLMVNYTSRSC